MREGAVRELRSEGGRGMREEGVMEGAERELRRREGRGKE